MEKEHSRYFCRTCLYDREIFLQEQMCYKSKEELELHAKVGDQGLVPIKPHANCDFCKRTFYTHEALYKHMRSCHINCFLCFEAHRRNEFFKDMKSLYNHFVAEHHVCRYERCMREGIFSQETVFAHEAQLAQHRITFHKNHNGALPEEKVRPVLLTRTTVATNQLSEATMQNDEEMASLPQSDKPIYFVSITNAEKPPKEVILPALESGLDNREERYPNFPNGLNWGEYKKHKADKKKKATGNGSSNDNNDTNDEKDDKATISNDAEASRGGNKTDEEVEDVEPALGAEALKTYTRAAEYESEMQDKMLRTLPQPLLDLPPSARMDSTLNKSSFLHAIDAVLDRAVGTVPQCKVKLMTVTAKQAADGGARGKVDIPAMKQHVANLSPLGLDSLSEMRGFLVNAWDSRFDTDWITGLRPLFFRTLRNEEHSGTPSHWLTWKYQAYTGLDKLRDIEGELIRIYIGMCLERNLSGYAGIDRAKEYPSLVQSAVAAAAKDTQTFNPEMNFAPEVRAGGGGWNNRRGGGNFAAPGSQEFPALPGDASIVAEDGTPLTELTMAERLKLQEQQERLLRAKKANKANGAGGSSSSKGPYNGQKHKFDLGFEEFPAMPVGLQPLGNPSAAKAKKPVTKASVFGASSSTSMPSNSGGASSSSSAAPAAVPKAAKPLKVPAPSASDITLNSNPNARAPTAAGTWGASSSSGAASNSSSSAPKTTSLLRGVQEQQQLRGAYAPVKLKNEAAERGQVAKKLADASAFPGLPTSAINQSSGPGKSRDTGGLLKGANIISKKTGTVVPVQQSSKQEMKKRDIFEDADDFADGDSFARVLLAAKAENPDKGPPSPLFGPSGKWTEGKTSLPSSWNDNELFPTLGGGASSSSSTAPGAGSAGGSAKGPVLVGKAKQVEEARLRQEAKDAKLAKQLQEAEEKKGAAGNQQKRGRQKKTLLAFG
ncbi:unnamed protein product [Amoebophrya sp. A25]|nr:unnamed protein product [Amoebophrya sp. A25]|eukprot:GSA25T00014150001.1